MLDKQQKPKFEPHFKLAEEFLDLRTLNTNIIVEHLEQNIKLREMTIEQQIRNKLLRK